jgi:hypothetical protein
MMNVPVVTLISHGHHLRQPVWNLKKRKVNTVSDLTQILTKIDIEELSVDEINRRIRDGFVYDDYKYQVESNIRITEPYRAENLHKPLYMCPHCHEENSMNSKGTKLWCDKCGETYEMDELGRLSNKNLTIFSHIPEWFKWQREKVRKEILSGEYCMQLDVNVDLLQNSDGYYRIGRGKLTHDYNGFKLEVGDLVIEISVLESFGVHIEYDYFGRGDGISFSKNNETFYNYPINDKFSVTKLHLATEEMYDLTSKQII